jgi:hypothetical protein
MVEVQVIGPAVGDTPVGVKTTAFGVLKLALLRVEELCAKLEVEFFAQRHILDRGEIPRGEP